MKTDDQLSEIRKHLNAIVEAKQKLKELGVTRSEKLLCDVGEWLAEELLEGVRPTNTNEEGYDLLVNGSRIQIKCHAKSLKNSARHTDFKYQTQAFDELMIIVMTPDYYVKEIFRVDWGNALRLTINGRLRWNSLEAYRVGTGSVHSKLRELFFGNVSL